MPQHKLEIPVFSPAAAKDATSLGAHRIELNAAGSYPVGGLTPSLSELSALLAQLAQESRRIPIRIMIRPRGVPGVPGEPDFVYSASELASMRDAIAGFKASGLLDAGRGDGFVFGVLLHHKTDSDGHGSVTVDVPSNSDLVTLARPFPCVFHRAFDDLLLQDDDDPDSSSSSSCLEDVVACGFAGILTSGGPGCAAGAANVRALRRIVRLAAGRVEVVVGGGVRSTNVGELVSAIDEAHGGGVAAERWFHSSCLMGGGGDGEAGIDRDEAANLLRALDQENKALASGG